MDNKRIFGSGPTCMAAGIVTVSAVHYLELMLKIPEIQIPDSLSILLFVIGILLTMAVVIWGFISLPIKKRGNDMVTDKAFRYFRHPIYAGFLDFFIIGLGFYLKSFGILVSAAILIYVCGKIVEKEEKQMIERFGDRYLNYQKSTKKFIPWVF
jgi:protein-S-isoprenylcysteine O-methyltransferase Ste14